MTRRAEIGLRVLLACGLLVAAATPPGCDCGAPGLDGDGGDADRLDVPLADGDSRSDAPEGGADGTDGPLDAADDGPGDGSGDDSSASAVCGDGIVDDLEECDGGTPRACTTTCGTPGGSACVDCRWAPCADSTAELCNDVDDNCDGRVDERVWCWVNPRDSAGTLTALWGFAADDVWAAGLRGQLVHWDGRSWSDVASASIDAVFALWGFAADDVWAAGENGTFQHWDGSRWSVVRAPAHFAHSIYDLWGAAPDDLWAVGFTTLLRWDGSAWIEWTAEAAVLETVWGLAADDVWAVGRVWGTDGGLLLMHWNGLQWTSVLRDEGTFARAMWGANGDDVWLGTDTGLLHFDGVGWARAISPVGPVDGLWGLAADDVWAVGDAGMAAHWDGSGWSVTTASPDDLSEVWGARPDDLWIVGQAGELLHGDGETWASWSTGPQEDLTGVWGPVPGGVAWAVGRQGGILRWDGSTWSEFARVDEPLNDVWGPDPDDGWAVGAAGMLVHWDGTSWTAVPRVVRGELRGVHGTARDDVWAVGPAGRLLHWDGSEWSTMSNGSTYLELSDVFAVARDRAWAAGQAVTGWDGTRWSEEAIARRTATNGASVWALDRDRVWVSAEGSLFRWSGTEWQPQDVESGWGCDDLIGTAPDELWGIGWGGLGAWDGREWSVVPRGPREISEAGLGGSSRAELWAVGEGGVILRRRE